MDQLVALVTSQLAKAGVELGLTYPRPLLLPPEWSRHAARDNKNTGGQKGINFYFKPAETGEAPVGRNNRKHLRGCRVQ